jgi:hypothetical protein
VGDTTLALFDRYQPDTVRVIDLSNPHMPHQASEVTTDQTYVVDVRAQGDTLFVTDFCKTTEAGSTPYPDHHHYPAQGWYHLHRFDLSNPNAPLALPVLNIPGVPADVAAGGEVVYTLSTWWDGDAMSQKRTLNVVRLDLEVATLIVAIEVPLSASIQVVRGIAYMTEGVSASVQYLAPDGHTHHYHTYNTTLSVIALPPTGSPTGVATYTLQGYSYKTMVRGDTVVLASTGSYDVLVMRTRDGTSLEVLGLFELNTLIYSFEALGDRIYLAQGVYGTSVLATGR